MRPYILAETNWKNIKDQDIEVAVLPWGATEAHNYHLPYATDIYEADALAAESGKRSWERKAKVVILPCIPFGANTGQSDIKLDINLNPSTQLVILKDIIEVLNRQGIKKLILLNSHGGNNFKPLLRELGLKFPEMWLILCNCFQILKKSDFFEEPGDHADEMETSLLLYLNPKLVGPLEEAGPGIEKKSTITAIKEGWAWSERTWSLVTEDTGIGNPKKATKEKGERFFHAVSEKISDLIVEVDATDFDKRYEK